MRASQKLHTNAQGVALKGLREHSSVEASIFWIALQQRSRMCCSTSALEPRAHVRLAHRTPKSVASLCWETACFFT